MKKDKVDIKLRLDAETPTFYLIRRLKECERSQLEIIKFDKIFIKLCSVFSMPKQEVWKLLYFLQDLSIIHIIPNHGVVLNYDFVERELRVENNKIKGKEDK